MLMSQKRVMDGGLLTFAAVYTKVYCADKV